MHVVRVVSSAASWAAKFDFGAEREDFAAGTSEVAVVLLPGSVEEGAEDVPVSLARTWNIPVLRLVETSVEVRRLAQTTRCCVGVEDTLHRPRRRLGKRDLGGMLESFAKTKRSRPPSWTPAPRAGSGADQQQSRPVPADELVTQAVKGETVLARPVDARALAAHAAERERGGQLPVVSRAAAHSELESLEFFA